MIKKEQILSTAEHVKKVSLPASANWSNPCPEMLQKLCLNFAPTTKSNFVFLSSDLLWQYLPGRCH